MADEATAQAGDQTGVTRDSTGTITEPGSQATTTPETSTPATTTSEPDGKTILTEGKKPEEKVEAAKGAPESYADYTVPEGFELDPAIKTKVDPIFKELGLSQDGAQKMVDLYTTLTAEASAAPAKAWNDMAASWKAAAESHPDLKGKLGPGQEVNVRIGKFLDGLGDPKLSSDFRQLMDITMAGNHPAFIRVLDYAAKRLTEGTPVSGNGPSPHGQSAGARPAPNAAAAMYPNLPSRDGRLN